MDYGRRQLADALAAEYVAGTLRGPARRRFESLLAGHPALRDAVSQWQDRLMPLTAAVEPEAPSPAVWRAVERRLWPAASMVQAASESDASTAPPWWCRLGVWRAATGLATVAALTFALLLGQPQPVHAPVLVVLQSTGAGGQGAASFVASVAGDGRSLVTRPVQPVALQAGRVLELWSVPPTGAPKSLGLIHADGSTLVARERLPATLLDGGTVALAVSVEPPGGSPTGAPTGPVVFAGKLQI